METLYLDRKFDPKSVWFVWGDVTGLYSNLPIEQLLDVIAKHLQAPAGTPQAAWFRMLHWILRKVFRTCVVQRKGKFYNSIHGIAMGSPLSPVASNLFPALLEDTNGTFEFLGHPLWECLGSQERLALLKRYIDDYLGILQVCTEHQVLELCTTLQERLKVAGLDVQMSHSNESCEMLDLFISKAPILNKHASSASAHMRKRSIRTSTSLGRRSTTLACSVPGLGLKCCFTPRTAAMRTILPM